jgi:putative membrane protein
VKKFIKSWAINTLAVLVAVYMVPGIHFKDDSLWTPFVTSLVLGILNAFIRPILMLLALPLLIFTLGLFTLVINALLLYFVSFLLGNHFAVDSFGAAFLGALVISIVSLLLNLITGGSRARVSFKHQRRPPDSEGGSGPVIDI